MSIDAIPKTEVIEAQWNAKWNNLKQQNKTVQWISKERDGKIKLEQQIWLTITGQEITDTLKSTNNWNTPRIDRISNFKLKYFTSTHGPLAAAFNL